MAYFPMYVDISDKKCVVVGGGRIAFHKIEILEQFGTKITVISPFIGDDIYALSKKVEKPLIFIEREFMDSDIFDARLVVAATDNVALNSHISDICKEKDILVNVVDVKEECTFIFPAIVKRDKLVISISTGGSSPAMASRIKKNIESAIPAYYSSIIELMGEHREYIKKEIHTQRERKKVYNELIDIAEKNLGSISFEIVKEVVDRHKISDKGGC